MNRILVIRGGAIGDFVLTLPALNLLRGRFPDAQIEILGHKHIIALAEKRFYANATRSIEEGALARFFARDAALPAELIAYFGGFDLIVSYLSDPDAIFHDNLARCRIKRFIAGPSTLLGQEHAAVQLARPLEQIGLHLQDSAARIFPTGGDRAFARDLLGGTGQPVMALHPGSGSSTKNWPIENWKELGEYLLSTGRKLLVVAGEAEEDRLRSLEAGWKNKPVKFAENLPLPHLAALLENSVFVGHDSGVSHIAAAVGAKAILLFGRTNPAVWAPANKNVTVLPAPNGDLRLLSMDKVIEGIRRWLSCRRQIVIPSRADDEGPH